MRFVQCRAVQGRSYSLPDDPSILQRMPRELHADNDKLRLVVQRFTRH